MSSKEVLLQQFFLETQQPEESVADYSIRIENLLRRATNKKQTEETTRHEMLCSKLWNGLRDPLLKNSSRYKYETETDFNKLRKEVRSIEQDLKTPRHITEGAKQLQQTTSSNITEKKLDEIFQQMKTMKISSRYKYETETDFNNLRKEIRCIEQGLLTSRPTTEEATKLHQTTINNTNEKKLDRIFQQMKKMRERMDGLEKKVYEAT